MTAVMTVQPQDTVERALKQDEEERKAQRAKQTDTAETKRARARAVGAGKGWLGLPDGSKSQAGKEGHPDCLSENHAQSVRFCTLRSTHRDIRCTAAHGFESALPRYDGAPSLGSYLTSLRPASLSAKRKDHSMNSVPRE